MRRVVWMGVIALLALLVLAPSVGAQTLRLDRPIDQAKASTQRQAALAQLFLIYSSDELSDGVYVGSEFCLACHPSKSGWRDTKHATFVRRPLVENSLVPRRGVIADYDHNGVDDFRQGLNFNNISSAFDAYKPNAPILSVEGGKYYVTVGQLKCPVTFTQAGQATDNAQRYVVKIPVADTPTGLSDSNYFAPLQYVPGPGWQPNSPQNWWDGATPRWGPGITAGMLDAHSGNYSKTCVGCHSTGIRRVGTNPTGEVSFDGFVAVLFEQNDPRYFDYDGDGFFDLMNVGCESCHGAGSAHILGGGDPSMIVNPEKLPVLAQVDICGRCHTQPHSVPNGTWAWPYNDATQTDWTPRLAKQGIPLMDFFTDASTRWPDGKHGKVTRPYHDFIESPKPTFRFGGVSCTDCHSPHRESQEHMIRTRVVEDGVTINTAVDDNTLCLSCHATHGPFAAITPEQVADIDATENRLHVGDVVSAHSHHPYGPERGVGISRCTECHMPTTSGHGTLTSPSHTFEPIAPAKTLMYQAQGGMPNSCAVRCHGFLVNTFDLGLDPNPNNSVWNESFDRNLARELQKYYGPGGVWWNTNND